MCSKRKTFVYITSDLLRTNLLPNNYIGDIMISNELYSFYSPSIMTMICSKPIFYTIQVLKTQINHHQIDGTGCLCAARDIWICFLDADLINITNFSFFAHYSGLEETH